MVPAASTSRAAGSASFSIAVPLGAGGAPTMQSLTLALLQVNGAAPAGAVTPVKMNLGKNAPGCTLAAGASTLTCTAKIAVPPGTDTFSVTTYAQPNQAGAQISTDRVTTAISAGRATSCVKKTSNPSTTSKTQPGVKA